MTHCPCGLEKNYSDCCGAYIDGEKIPLTPEALMRSRYTAYTKANIDYIQRTMRGAAMKQFNADEATAWAKKVEWRRLDILDTKTEGAKGFVEFLAYFYDNGKRHAIHELSEFHLDNGIWYYVDGTPPKEKPIAIASRIGRNEPCHCQSGKKYKKCCGVAAIKE